MKIFFKFQFFQIRYLGTAEALIYRVDLLSYPFSVGDRGGSSLIPEIT